jgi:effector-binding domain-containing protein
MSERGLAFGMPFWEVYLTEPSPEMDPAALRTELNLPLGD